MPKTLELEITCDEARVKPNKYNSVKVVLESPQIQEMLGNMAWSDIVGFIGSENAKPSDIFTEDELSKWAEDNGYTK